MTQMYKAALTIESQQEHMYILEKLYERTDLAKIKAVVKRHLALGKIENLQG
jgi:hypothetical protein